MRSHAIPGKPVNACEDLRQGPWEACEYDDIFLKFYISLYGVSQNRAPQYRPQNIIILIIGTPKKVPLILGNPHMESLNIHGSMTSMAPMKSFETLWNSMKSDVFLQKVLNFP